MRKIKELNEIKFFWPKNMCTECYHAKDMATILAPAMCKIILQTKWLLVLGEAEPKVENISDNK